MEWREPYTVLGSGPTLLAFDREPKGYFDALAQKYRVIVIDYPPRGMPKEHADSFTADRVSADVLAVADGVDRLTALACGGWPPLGGQYQETLAFTEAAATRGGETHFLAYYRSVRNWPSARQCLGGTRGEMEGMGWSVRLVDGFGHELGARPDVVTPLLREFFDPILQRVPN